MIHPQNICTDIFKQIHLLTCHSRRDCGIWKTHKLSTPQSDGCLNMRATYVKLWDWMRCNLYRSVKWNRLVYVWSCCSRGQVIYMEYGTMHCWQACHMGATRWISPNAPALSSSAFIPACASQFVNILVMSRGFGGMQTSQNICAGIISNLSECFYVCVLLRHAGFAADV